MVGFGWSEWKAGFGYLMMFCCCLIQGFQSGDDRHDFLAYPLCLFLLSAYQLDYPPFLQIQQWSLRKEVVPGLVSSISLSLMNFVGFSGGWWMRMTCCRA